MMLTRLAHSLTTTALRRAMSTKPLFIYTAGTANGLVVSILLEELKAVYGSNNVDYESVLSSPYHHISQLRSE